MNTVTFDRAMAEASQLMGRGAHQAALDRIEPLVAGRKAVGPEHAIHLQALIALNRRQDASRALDAASGLAIDSADAADALAFFARHLDRHELSYTLYRKAVDLSPREARMWFNLATSERSLGNLSAAAEAVNKACQLDPQMLGAVLLRSEVMRATEQANHVEELRDRLKRAGDTENVVMLSYALGKELHELRQYDEAFAAFSRGADARRRALQYDVAQDEHKLARIRDAFSSGTSDAPVRERPARHVFIIGMPRSGTTLTERILGSLPDVRSNNETNNFTAALLQHSAQSGGDVFERASRADFAAVGAEYDALAASDGFAGTIIEKLPFNYLYVGAILQAIPDAAIVALRRHPVDSCFAMYRTLFAGAYPFSYRFDELARYFAAYERLMRHWDEIYPGRICYVDYEGLVQAPNDVAPEIASACGLPWSDDALDLSRNRSASLTASAAQVRGGIYTSSAGVWQNYRPHLEPLAQALRDCGVGLELDG